MFASIVVDIDAGGIALAFAAAYLIEAALGCTAT